MASSNQLVLTFSRLTLASIAVMHGLANGFGLFGGPEIEGFTTKLSGTASTGSATLPLWAGLELLVGICLLLGSFARVAAGVGFALVVVLVVVDERYTTFWAGDKGLEFPLAVAALCLVVLTHGPGACCFDVRAAWKRMREKAKVKK
jgi:uncharacterized membrane protein YphA (DoxX/SURF4 family)